MIKSWQFSTLKLRDYMNTRLSAVWLIIWMLVGGTMMFMFSGPNGQQSGAVKDLSYGEFMDQVERGNIAKVTLNDTGEIRGQLKNPLKTLTEFTSKALNADMSYVESLRKDIKSNNPDAVINLEKSGGSFSNSLFSMLPFILLIGLWMWFMRRAQGQQMNHMNSFIKPRTRLDQDHVKKTFQDVAGVNEAKEDLLEIIEFLKDPQRFQKLGAHIPKGVLLIGPTGTGKTLLAKAVAGEANVPFLSTSGSEFVEMFVGVGAVRVREIFEDAGKQAPCIIFIDELDAVGRRRGTGIGGGHDEREQTLNQLLVEMDGFTTNSGVIVIAATNRPDVLDPALLRPGRFDRKVVVDRPDVNGRSQILSVHTKGIPLEDGVDLTILARGTSGFTGADLANLVNEAALRAAGLNKKTVAMDHFEFAKDKVTMGAERKSLLLSPDEKKVIAYHEAGHTVVALFTKEADPIHKVTIIPRGMSLGSTHQLPEDDKHNLSKEYLEGRIAILMGGRTAEDMFIGKITTGAEKDIEVATDLARRMVREWGMSELGPVKFGSQTEHPFLGRNISEASSNYSQETANKIDGAINKIISEGLSRAKVLIEENKSLVERLVAELIEKEVLNADEIKLLAESS